MQRIALLRPSNLNTRRADENAILDFMRFAGIVRLEEFRIVAHAHRRLTRRGGSARPSRSTMRYRLASLASLFWPNWRLRIGNIGRL
jgi:hypothetical protein